MKLKIFLNPKEEARLRKDLRTWAIAIFRREGKVEDNELLDKFAVILEDNLKIMLR